MKIHSQLPPALQPAAQPGNRSNATGRSNVADKNDQVSINPLVNRVQTAAAGETAPAFDAGKIDAIKSAIARGEFSINADAIADGLIASARELLSAQKP
ncbi:flagellar biosynthesis anti-sigma factor FlgM [Laribacter hongkongensis]|jgi:negative regulator of flagellin synthesis FlgM|uniref:Negative regulator of flagellin synthesis n=1 Tax=Laribacter hongkongensis (strain HLHK9) TaxID=557598 RepID=C1DCU3_LARHH|nr:flagellar biosynthesis anti-sigma factor FlgM [Laribacter hongkongensis]ACO73578.1 FlgM [Laribacter hongkongensis HLHK9]MCG8993432.1 flagellar biosynthesis anti-sigma factor FlgM [Laribacter hongkongensis]MCG8994978.1 flagellar biosynthesis anti-sigma factor FlgM [Laribacter hongkongensis]MCG8999417.1 flagellar biosynthesis anti-sigma factor FlgM [Laribacter hongkongensis]MCG9000386.1 flagellar biosynthesis anti-sigma factor FlgM [Laribacter hongkongensis]